MVCQVTPAGTAPTLLLFGPQALSLNAETIAWVWSTLSKDKGHSWMFDAILDLPRWFDEFTKSAPHFASDHGHQALRDLTSWLKTGSLTTDPRKLPNIALSPLVVAIQLLQFTQYSKVASSTSQRESLIDGRFEQVSGLCTGLLSALAVASSSSHDDLARYGAVALRLSMLIGMTVDAQDSAGSKSKSFAVSWPTPSLETDAKSIIQKYPEAYISVHYDENRATVTVSDDVAAGMLQQLEQVGASVHEIALHGRFHWLQHQDALELLNRFCDQRRELQYVDKEQLRAPVFTRQEHLPVHSMPLHSMALSSILVETSYWHQDFSTAIRAWASGITPRIVSFGLEKFVPPSLLRTVSQQTIHMSETDSETLHAKLQSRVPGSFVDTDIAVVGMSCKTAGANDLGAFWDLLCAGKSQHQQVPNNRFDFETTFREQDPDRKWYGNFLEDFDKFDHKFFKKSPRESATMDPQQRLLLQVAYQSVEQSGYFRHHSNNTNVGCYIGVCAVDYENNVACHAPNAFTATGNLRGFIAGKVSHYFGWTGPGLTIDTACSSSTVAVHQACQSILSGECEAALAGGTHVMTSPLWFQNLSGATFLSPSGQCKPFDANADGYCRGEGVATVFLKKMSTAIADGDQILGVIAATGVQQNHNDTPIFVPNSHSLSSLFKSVIKQARVEPQQVGVVEAHGTGTGVGDPAEYKSVCEVLGGPRRSSQLQLGSVKGLVGHAECTSGILSLVKTLLMTLHGVIPPQASHEKMNPAIHAKETDQITVSKALVPWTSKSKIALINNYGASGSNASLVVIEAPKTSTKKMTGNADSAAPSVKYPFWLSAIDDRSLQAYSRALSKVSVGSAEPSIADVSFALSRQSNRRLGRALLFSCSTLHELQQSLDMYADGVEHPKADGSSPSRPKLKSHDTTSSQGSTRSQASSTMESDSEDLLARNIPGTRPVILCFGGQTSKFIGLSRRLYNDVQLFRDHIDRCDEACRQLGVEGVLPGIFEGPANESPIKLQTMLFALQYSCAQAWIACGIQVSAVVGHSFGELTALCIAGVLGLEDALKLVIGRATIVQQQWEADSGAMMAIDAELKDVMALLATANAQSEGSTPASIACFNGPRSFTLGGSTQAIAAVLQVVNADSAYAGCRVKVLNVTNAFHTALVEPLTSALEKSAIELPFSAPRLHIERATESRSQSAFEPRFVADHMRKPVYFSHAVQRLDQQFPSAVWLEAGSATSIAKMASRALGNPSRSHFQSIEITCEKASDNLAEATVSLWKAGLDVSFWGHHQQQASSYAPLLLPPYQFEKSSHWVKLEKAPKVAETVNTVPEQVNQQLPETLLTFAGYQDSQNSHAQFRVNTMIPKYQEIISGHIIAETAPILPATTQIELAIEALRSLRPDLATQKLEPQIHGVENQSPICINESRSLWLEVLLVSAKDHQWSFKFYSTGLKSAAETTHTTGNIQCRSASDHQLLREFARYERLSGHQQCLDVLSSNNADDIIQGRTIYKAFGEIVDYGEQYRGLRKLVGRGNQSAGQVEKSYNAETWLDAYLSDAFCQVGGIWANCMTDRDPSDMYIATGIEQWTRSPLLGQQAPRPTAWNVLANHHGPVEKAYTTDIFVFDATTGALMETMMGIRYVRVAKASMRSVLQRLTLDSASKAPANPTVAVPMSEVRHEPLSEPKLAKEEAPVVAPLIKASEDDTTALKSKQIVTQVKNIIAELSGLEVSEIQDDSELADLGIDSLMGLEMTREIETALECSLPINKVAEVTDLPGLLQCVQEALGLEAVSGEAGEDADVLDTEVTSSGAASVFSPANTPVSAASSVASHHKELSAALQSAADSSLHGETLLGAFSETKALTDEFILNQGCADYVKSVLPMKNELCVALTLEVFQSLGCDIGSAKNGEQLSRIPHLPEHQSLVDYLYLMLQNEVQLVTSVNGEIRRTATPMPSKSSTELRDQIVLQSPEHAGAVDLTYYAGNNLADVLCGKTDGVKLIFGSSQGRNLVSALYGNWPLNETYYKQMQDFLTRLVATLPPGQGPLKILEMGAGTGGTTKWLVPHLARLGYPVEYTFTDLGPSFVASARKTFKQYPFMKFRTHNIEDEPASDLLGTQHVIIASNAVHATRSLVKSTANIRKALRPDGALMMLEMTGTLYWCDMIFGLFEGWWLFEDGRTHAVANEARWKRDLLAAGYGRVDWSDGARPENQVERLLIAVNSEARYDTPASLPPTIAMSTDLSAVRVQVEEYVRANTVDFPPAPIEAPAQQQQALGTSILVTGATGSLGCHLVECLTRMDSVDVVYCLNRRSSARDPFERQLESLRTKGISLSPEHMGKLQVLEVDSSKPKFGLDDATYGSLASSVSHIIHNAWPMSAKRPLKGFAPQFQVMRNLLDLASHAASLRLTSSKVTFQLISSIAVVGHHPLITGGPVVPEERVAIESVLPNGYGYAKYACELMLDATLHEHPDRFQTMAVRIGQIAASAQSGYWNTMEHLPFLWKSSQTLGVLPDFDGVLSWTPVDDVAGTLVDLLQTEAPYPVYHIDNPVRQPWKTMTPLLAAGMGIAETGIIPFQEWVDLVRTSAEEGRNGKIEAENNPATQLVDFLDGNFTRMSCGGLLLGTKKVVEHSATLRKRGPVDAAYVARFLESWKRTAFLK